MRWIEAILAWLQKNGGFGWDGVLCLSLIPHDGRYKKSHALEFRF
jgi:hypothetical protein